MQYPSCILLALLPSLVVSKFIKINVGGVSAASNSLTYFPNTTVADIGDTLEFHFIDQNVASSVVMGDASAPCRPADEDDKQFFNSGPILGDPTGSNVFFVKVRTTDPIILYCGVAKHCPTGMVGIVNPSSKVTLRRYALVASKVKNPIQPDGQQGGVFKKGRDGGPVAGTAPEKESVEQQMEAAQSATETIANGLEEAAEAAATLLGIA